jgi:membrane associated rhomboid family serine protease
MYPRAGILLFFVLPVPALIGALIFVGLDVVGLIAQSEGGGLPIGHGAHLGGAATGALYYLLVVRRLRNWRTASIDFGDVAMWYRLISPYTPPRDGD